jgi:hypothetical protein
MKKKTPTQLMIDEASYRAAAQELPHWDEEIDAFAKVMARSFVESLPDGMAAELGPWLKTAEGEAAVRSSWPRIVDAYLSARAKQ